MATVVLRYDAQTQYTYSSSHPEYSLGVVVGLYTLLARQAGPNPHYTITFQNGLNRETVRLNDTTFHTIVQPALQVPAENVLASSSLLPRDHMGWWIRTPFATTYNLYAFTTPEFIGGFIDAYLPFQEEFRNDILGPPFAFGTHMISLGYLIPEYDIAELESSSNDGWQRHSLVLPFEATPTRENVPTQNGIAWI